jgi:AcrR family transcriptional regulator
MARRARFQRARQPHQKAARRGAILGAAASLLAEQGLDAVSLHDVAQGAGITKSNVYRYFESREAIFLELLIADQARWVETLERKLAALPGRRDPRAVGHVLASTLAAEPRLCALVSVLGVVLEKNLSDEAVLEFKRAELGLSLRIANAVHAALPELGTETLAGFVRHLHAAVVGLWPIAHPAPAVERALARPELASFRSDFALDLEELLVALLVGLSARG